MSTRLPDLRASGGGSDLCLEAQQCALRLRSQWSEFSIRIAEFLEGRVARVGGGAVDGAQLPTRFAPNGGILANVVPLREFLRRDVDISTPRREGDRPKLLV